MEENVKLQELCRVCANSKSELVNVYHIKHEDKLISEVLSCFLQNEVTENDGKPSNICMTCLPKLIESFELINLAKVSDQYFEMLISSQTSVSEPLVNIVPTELSGYVEDPLVPIKLENTCDEDQANEMPPENIVKGRKRRRKFQCDVCGQVHQSNQDLNQHLCEGGQIICEYCSEVYHTTNEILSHLNIHRDNSLSYECDQCKQSFKMELLHSWHGKKHERFPFVCKICAKDFESRYSYHNHTRLVHNNRRPHICTLCKKGFKDRSSLNKHYIVHTDERPFTCSECPKRFQRQGGLTAHLLTHQQIHSGDQTTDRKINDIKLTPEDCESSALAEEMIDIKEETQEIDCNFEMVVPVQAVLTEYGNENEADNASKCGVCGEIQHDHHLCQGKEIACEYCNAVFQSTSEILQHLDYHAENIFHFDCQQCSISFKMEILRDWHEVQHNRILFGCEICGKTFRNRNTLTKHTRVVHSDERPFRCAKCGNGFKEKSALMKHSVRHTNERLFGCPECPRRFFWQSNLAAHIHTHRKENVTNCLSMPNDHQEIHSAPEIGDKNKSLDSSNPYRDDSSIPQITVAKADTQRVRKSDRIYECFVCHFQTRSLKRLEGHLERHKQINSFKCSICEEQYNDEFSLNSHLCKGTDIKCEYCSVVCRSTRDVLEHLQTHVDDILLYKCSRCWKSFKMKCIFDWHQMAHDRMEFVCQVCSKRFGTRRTLINHMRFVHTNERPHLCAECGRGFKQKCALKKHAVAHSKDRPFSCPHCPKHFPRLGNLKTHIQTHRIEKHVCLTCGAVKDSAGQLRTHQKYHKDRTHECEICGYKFFSRDKLKTHMRTHTGEKPFMCEFCPAAYAQRNDLVKHLRTQIGDKTYICKKCNTSFRYYADHRKHQLYCNTNEPIKDGEDVPTKINI